MRHFAGKVAVITGAGSGIGRSLALNLASRGAQLAVSDIDAAAIADSASQCEALGAKTIAYQLDVADRDAVYDHARQVREAFGQVNLVVNNAGVALTADIADMSWPDFEWLMNINFWGVTHGTKAFLPHLIASGDGHIVNISSVFGLVGVPWQSAYSAAKFAVRGFTEALRQEMKIAAYPVGVTCAHPGGVKTNIIAHSRGLADSDREAFAQLLTRMPATRPDPAAAIIIKAVEKNKPRVLIGPDARLFDFIPRVLGPGYQDVVARSVRLVDRRRGKPTVAATTS